jgi:hypothetical protein
MSSLEKIRYWKRRNVDNFDLVRSGIHRTQSPHYSYKQTLPKFNRVSRANSEAKLLRSSRAEQPPRVESSTNLKMYRQLNHQLQEIKETLKESLVSISQRPKKKQSVNRGKVATEASEPERRYNYTRNYQDVLGQIAEIKSRNRANRTHEHQAKVVQAKAGEEEKTLFYGVDFIDSVEFKIKIKLTKTHYYLFAKNTHAKVMVEMGVADYTRLQQTHLRGNPCHIFKMLILNGNHIGLVAKAGSGLKTPPSFKSYLSYG